MTGDHARDRLADALADARADVAVRAGLLFEVLVDAGAELPEHVALRMEQLGEALGRACAPSPRNDSARSLAGGDEPASTFARSGFGSEA